MATIEISITLKPDTTLEEAQRARDILLQGIELHLFHLQQQGAIVGSSLEID